MAKSEHNYEGLRYRTRGDANPQGRPRVYFCCHPDDFAAYFEPVCTEILGVQTNAAIWYYDPAEGIPVGPEFLEDLRQMQLLVIPVTSRFVYRESRAREVELPLAVEAHVPVLPIMQEDIPNRDFSRACGSLQTLSRYASMSDPTATPYEERLRKFLQSVLVGDELAERVRAAFDAYVFLSYRKKDRAQAQRIMRLIHEDELCRDIAIWYDEFLAPGEDFHDAISDALRKCSVFSLVVTPHLLEPGNFVMREEYPAARQSDKPVVPVEAVETDHEELADAYEGIGGTVSADDRDGLSSRLLDSLREVALRENDQDPQHNFFIGLAYLTGIDVEVNHERALALITSAAEAGLPEAYERLVAMYSTGEGVERDYRRAVEWQERYVEALEDEYATSPTHAQNTFRAYYKLGALCWDTGDPLGALNAYSRAETIASTIEQMEGSTESHLHLLTVIRVHGDLMLEMGDDSSAYALHERSLSMAEALEANTDSVESKQALLSSLCSVGDDLFKRSDATGALALYKRALLVTSELVKRTETIECRRLLPLVLEKVGTALDFMGDFDKSLNYYWRSADISAQIAEESGDLPDWRCFSSALYDLGSALWAVHGRLKEALEVLEDSLSIRESLVTETESLVDLSGLAEVLQKLAYVRDEMGDLEEVGILYDRAVEAAETTARMLGTVNARLKLSETLKSIGFTRFSVESEDGQDKALSFYSRALSIDADIAKETNSIRDRRNYAETLYSIGCTLDRMKDSKGALEAFEEALAINEMLASETKSIRDKRHLRFSLLRTGDACRELGLFERALFFHKQMIDIDEAFVREAGSADDRRCLSEAYERVGDDLRMLGRWSDAITPYELALDTYGHLYDERGTPLDRKCLSESITKLIGVHKTLGNQRAVSDLQARFNEIA